ncbi:MAG: class I SAM-dependent methyltransferase [Candidatus Shapirobacteria bacterium]|nr:class I SAM-dependent methyltransferase [Candidatus Shapirobacteria bacterium]
MEDRLSQNEIISPRENHIGYIREVIPFISQNHLDIGCGDGSITKHLAGEKPNSKIIGFDIDKNKIKNAQDRVGPNYKNLSFVSLLNSETFNSASAFRSFHEVGNDLFNIASDHLKSGSEFVIIDYNFIKDNKDEQQTKNLNDIFYSLSEFQNIFNSEEEFKEVEEIGWQNAYFLHTQYNRHICQKMAEESGLFETIKCDKVNEKLFIWVGRKK